MGLDLTGPLPRVAFVPTDLNYRDKLGLSFIAWAFIRHQAWGFHQLCLAGGITF